MEQLGERLGRAPTPQDVLLCGLLEPRNLLDVARNFVVFEVEGGRPVRKLTRYRQFIAVNEAMRRIRTARWPSERGGVVWLALQPRSRLLAGAQPRHAGLRAAAGRPAAARGRVGVVVRIALRVLDPSEGRPRRDAVTHGSNQARERMGQLAEGPAPSVGGRQRELRAESRLIHSRQVARAGLHPGSQMLLGSPRTLRVRMKLRVRRDSVEAAQRFDGGQKPGFVLSVREDYTAGRIVRCPGRPLLNGWAQLGRAVRVPVPRAPPRTRVVRARAGRPASRPPPARACCADVGSVARLLRSIPGMRR